MTACVAGRAKLLAEPRRAAIAKAELLSSPSAGDVEWLVGTVMPDHIHALFVLGHRLPLDRLLAKLKGNITRRCGLDGMCWQENVYEHRLRRAEQPEAYAFYIYMNPYRAGICALRDSWPWWVCADPQRFEFCGKWCPNGSPHREWLTEVEEIASRIHHGE